MSIQARIILFTGFLFSFLSLSAQKKPDQSLSPYFIISADSAKPAPDFPLKQNSANVTISGVIADVEITQVYINHSKRPLEAVYVFPASTRAAVYAMEMQVGRRTITAEIRERNQARTEYTAAKQAGQTASLLEQDRPNIFRMNVANIMPNDSIIVRISYTELLVPENGIYEFVYPTVVGPRYTGANGSEINIPSPNNPGSGTPYTKSGVKPLYTFDMKVGINSPVPFEKIESNSHKILLSFQEKNQATVLLSPEEKDGGNRDFVLRYKLTGPAIKTGMMTYEGGDENYFLFMMQPPARVSPDSIPPREYIFVMDVSGSMAGYPIETSKKLVSNLVSGLRPGDLFNVVQFAGGSATFSPVSLAATQQNIDSALRFIALPHGGGGTELKYGMERAMGIPRNTGYSRTIVIATDGLISAEAAVFRSIHENLDSANVFAFGIGGGVNRYLIEGIAFAGRGEPAVVQYSGEADSAAAKFRKYISAPVLTNIHVDFGTMDVYDLEPAHIPDLFAERPLIVTGKYRGKAEGNVTVTGVTGKNAYRETIPLGKVKAQKKNKAIKYLWARERIRLLGYESAFARGDSSLIKEITTIGLKYSLLTEYTSFIAIYKKVRNKDGVEDSTVVQPIPLPQNVSDMSIGGNLSMNTVQIISARSLSYAGVTSCDVALSSCVVTIKMYDPFFPEATLSGINSGISEAQKGYDGKLVQPEIYLANGGAALSGAFASRVMSTVPDYLFSSFSIPGRDGFLKHPLSAKNTGDIRFGNYRNGAILHLGMNSAGIQQAGFTYNKSFSYHQLSTHSLTIAGNEAYSFFGTDRNQDGFTDIPGRKDANFLLAYIINTNKDSLQVIWRSEIFAHASANRWGQDSESANPFLLNDDSKGLYFNTNYYRDYDKPDGSLVYNGNLSAGWSERKLGFAGKQFHATEPFVLGTLEMQRYRRKYDLSATVASSWYGGETIMTDGLRYTPGYTRQSANLKFSYTEKDPDIVLQLRGDMDSRFGSWLSPSVLIRGDYKQNYFFAELNRLRSQTFTPGSVLPALISSRGYVFDRNLLPDDGWQYQLTWRYSKYIFGKSTETSLNYQYNDYRRLVIADLDTEPGKLLVYNSNHRIAQQRLNSSFRMWITNRMQLQVYYLMTIRQSNYGDMKLDDPLLPRHQAGLLYAWEKRLPGSDNYFKIKTIARYTGRQRLPGHGWSEEYCTFDLSAEYNWQQGRWSVQASAINLLDYRQKVAVFGASNPNGSDFDAGLNWGPLAGRVFDVSLVYRIPNRN